MQIISSFVNYLVIPCKLLSHPLWIIFSPGETILGFNEPDHDEHPLTPGLATYHFPKKKRKNLPLPLTAEVALWYVAEKAVEGWLQLQERYHDRFAPQNYHCHLPR